MPSTFVLHQQFFHLWSPGRSTPDLHSYLCPCWVHFLFSSHRSSCTHARTHTRTHACIQARTHMYTHTHTNPRTDHTHLQEQKASHSPASSLGWTLQHTGLQWETNTALRTIITASAGDGGEEGLSATSAALRSGTRSSSSWLIKNIEASKTKTPSGPNSHCYFQGTRAEKQDHVRVTHTHTQSFCKAFFITISLITAGYLVWGRPLILWS